MTPPTKVYYLIDKLHRAGAQTNLSQLVRGLDRGRFRPTVVCLLRGGSLAEELAGAGVEVIVLGLDRIYGRRALRALGAIARTLREERVGIVHTYLVSANLFGAFARALAGVETLVTTRRDLGFSRNWRLALVEELFVNSRATCVVTPARAVSERAREERGLTAERIVTIPNGVDTRSFRPAAGLREEARARWAIPASAPVAGVIANFLPVKGHADLLRAAAKLSRKEARFVLVGDGELRGELERLVQGLGLEGRVLFTGARSDTRELLALLDVVVCPSHSEGASNVLLEAMAMARPIVATAVGGNVEILRHEETALLVPPREPDALAESLDRALAGGAEIARMAERAREVVERDFALEKMVARYMALYEELTAS